MARRVFETILVPHDLSRHADRALRIAADLTPTPGRLIVLHVANRYGNAVVQKLVLEGARRRVERTVSRVLGLRHGLRVERRIVAGNPYVEIARAARDAGSIILCTAGRTGLSRIVMGSVAEKVVRHAPRPVLSFRPGAVWPKRLFGSVLVPHDFSRHATRALKLAASLAGAKGRLNVLHVASVFPGVNRIVRTQILAGERRRLQRITAKSMPAKGGPSVQCRVESGDSYRHIVDAARKGDVIVMCTAGRTGLPHFVIGSVAEKVVRHARVPVLTFRPAVMAARHARPRRSPGAFRHALAARRSRSPRLA